MYVGTGYIRAKGEIKEQVLLATLTYYNCLLLFSTFSPSGLRLYDMHTYKPTETDRSKASVRT